MLRSHSTRLASHFTRRLRIRLVPRQPSRAAKLRLDTLEPREMPGNVWQGLLLGVAQVGMLEPISAMWAAFGEEAILPRTVPPAPTALEVKGDPASTPPSSRPPPFRMTMRRRPVRQKRWSIPPRQTTRWAGRQQERWANSVTSRSSSHRPHRHPPQHLRPRGAALRAASPASRFAGESVIGADRRVRWVGDRDRRAGVVGRCRRGHRVRSAHCPRAGHGDYRARPRCNQSSRTGCSCVDR